MKRRLSSAAEQAPDAAVAARWRVDAERQRQDRKWGEQNHNDHRWLAILVEEVGELAQAINDDDAGGPHAGTAEAELIQVAAVAVQWLECYERRRWRRSE